MAAVLADGDPSLHGAPDGPKYMMNLKTSARGSNQHYKSWWNIFDTKNYREDIQAAIDFFRTWIVDRKVKKDQTETHVSLSGGKFVIPHETEAVFLDSYGKLVLAGVKMFFVERPTIVMRLAVDLDFKQLSGVTPKGIEAASVVAHRVVAGFFPGKLSTCIVCATSYKDEEKMYDDAKIMIKKTGVHLHWPEYLTTELQALHIRESIVSALIDRFGMRTAPMNDWRDVVDRKIYGIRGSGLRMVGSLKNDTCPTCKGRRSKDPGATGLMEERCKTCFGRGKVQEGDGRPYFPIMLLDASGQRCMDLERAYLNDFAKLVLDTKIRTNVTEDGLQNGFQLPSGAPLFMGEITKTGIVKEKKQSTPARERVVLPDDPSMQALQQAIREAAVYANVVVCKMTKTAKQYTVHVTGTNCRWCQNIGREHVSNRIYFVCTKEDGLVQRCHDNADELSPEMGFGLCKNYNSGKIPLSVQAMAVLWPDTQETSSVTVTSSDASLEDASMKTLLAYGDFLCRSVYGSTWTTTLGLVGCSVKEYVLSKTNAVKKYKQLDPRDLGCKGPQAYKDMGLSWAESVMLSAESEAEASGLPKPLNIKSLKEFERLVMSTFDDMVAFACNIQEPEVFKGATRMTDFVLKKTKHKKFTKLIEMVYSAPPLRRSTKCSVASF